jgi:hypothetical protein
MPVALFAFIFILHHTFEYTLAGFKQLHDL